jgi:hypothetical protein
MGGATGTKQCSYCLTQGWVQVLIYQNNLIGSDASSSGGSFNEKHSKELPNLFGGHLRYVNILPTKEDGSYT